MSACELATAAWNGKCAHVCVFFIHLLLKFHLHRDGGSFMDSRNDYDLFSLVGNCTNITCFLFKYEARIGKED